MQGRRRYLAGAIAKFLSHPVPLQALLKLERLSWALKEFSNKIMKVHPFHTKRQHGPRHILLHCIYAYSHLFASSYFTV